MTKNYIVTTPARTDFYDIYQYTADNWGFAQADKYQDLIETHAETIAENPFIGQMRESLGLGVRSWPAERHIIYYRVDSDAIVILRILHERQDPQRASNLR